MSNSNQPPDFLLPCLFSIESAVSQVFEAHPRLEDKEVEAIYVQLYQFFKKLAQGAELDEPFSTITRKQALIKAILTALDAREELGGDEHILQNPEYTLGGKTIPYLETLYATGFNNLRSSARFWRKRNGKRGYLNFISEQMREMDS